MNSAVVELLVVLWKGKEVKRQSATNLSKGKSLLRNWLSRPQKTSIQYDVGNHFKRRKSNIDDSAKTDRHIDKARAV